MSSTRDPNWLLETWREVGRHMRLHESAGELLSLLREQLPLEALTLVHLLSGQQAVEVLVQEAKGGQALRPGAALRFTATDYPALLRWCRRGGVTHLAADADWPAALAPLGLKREGREALAAPLGGATPTGLLLLTAPAGKRYTPAQQKLAAALQEPLSAAMDNHMRLQEIDTLRAAAEADRQSLLARLGREALEDEIVGSSQGLKPVMERVALVAASDASVLILGETGAGKEVVARAIHTGSARAQGPFIRVNCGAISPELIDSELFGHEKGSFTGAVAARRGWFERADGGTLFLDEIGELPASAQVRLLRVLQDGRFHKLGGEREIEVDVRIVAATHRDMAQMVQSRQFREDLWYRIAVFPIILPPLRERQDDIPELALHFARRASRRLGLPFCAPTAEDIALLQGYPWPGNVREMSTVMERAAILGQGERLAIRAALGIAPPAARVETAGGQSPAQASIASLDQALRAHIETALRTTRGRVAGEHGAAALLSVNPNTLRARMRKLGITPREFKRPW